MAVIFLDVEKSFDTTWHPALLYKLSNLQYSTSIIEIRSSFPSSRKFRVSVESEIPTPWETQAGVPHCPILPSIHNILLTHGVFGVFSHSLC